ncbi:HDOD domain-containing protein [Alkalilimnicola ehrlichii]|nr:HDOD domain-containing protein [Alkalilimnicola ehrlichii]
MPLNATETTDDFSRIFKDLIAWMESGQLVLPGVPEVAQKVRAVASDTDAGPKELANVINIDPPLAAHIIKVSNSVSYRGGTVNRSIQGAVTRLGFRLTATLATSFSILQIMGSASGDHARIRDLYAHSLAVAERTYAIARRHKHLNAEDALLAGLVHDLGVLVISQYLRHQDRFNNEQQNEAIIQALHPQAGATLLRRWEFPEQLIEAIEVHEDWERGEASTKPDYTDLIIVANYDVYRGTPKLAGITQPPLAFTRLGLQAGRPLVQQDNLGDDMDAARRLLSA